MCAKRVGSRWIDSYIFVHGAVAKRTLSQLGMHGVVVRSTFCFWRMNPLAGSGVSIARNCSETQIFRENCRKHRAKRSFWKLVRWNLEEASHETIILEAISCKIVGSVVRNARFGSLFCEIWKKPRTKRSFWKLFLWKLLEALCETLDLEAWFCEICRKPCTKRSFWKLFLWKVAEASHEMLVLEAFSVQIVTSFAYSSCGLSHKHHHTNTAARTTPQEHHHTNTKTSPHHHKNSTTRTPPQNHHHKNTTTPPRKHQHKNTTTRTPHQHKNTTTPTQKHHHKNTTTKTPPHKHNDKNTTTKTPPQNTTPKTPPQKHHHKNTTTPPQKHHHTTTKTPLHHH